MITVRLLSSMGDDRTVANAARVSFAKEKATFDDKDARLIRYLARNNHWSPFGHCMASFHVTAPIFVARQLGKHQVGLVWNEVSRRYVGDAPKFWTPEIVRSRPDGSIKQGSVGAHYDSKWWIGKMQALNASAASLYNSMIHDGVAPEQARAVLPSSLMTEWWWTGSLAAWARVCALRLDPHAQVETFEIAAKISAHMLDLFPVSWAALMPGEVSA